MARSRVWVPSALVLALAAPAGLAPFGALAALASAEQERGGRCRSGYVALTFDDGPAAPTRRLVRILSGAGVPATFFMVGQRVAASPRLARRVERAGMLIANHSWAHANMTTQTSPQVAATLRATQTALRRAGTHPTRLMRPPYGALDDAARVGIRRAGFVPVLWTVDPRDWAGGSARQIAARIIAGLRPNATNIVLQHDGVRHSPVSVDAVPMVIRGARSRGYCFTALNENGRPGFPTPRASVSVTDSREGEAAIATIRLSKPPGRATSVLFRTRSRTATAGKDVERIARRVMIPAGRLSTRVRIPVIRDGIDEYAERFEVTIGRPRGVRIGDGTAVSRIADADPPPVVRGVDRTVTEPETDPASATVRLRLSRPSAKRIVVIVATRPGTADGADYLSVRLRRVMPPGASVLLVDVTVLADDVEEAEESFTVEVVRARRVRTGPAATVTIIPPEPEPEPPVPSP
jgi:peptidoglycan/xylan/chitin deacetylase (PgdA/CDA1 family)